MEASAPVHPRTAHKPGVGGMNLEHSSSTAEQKKQLNCESSASKTAGIY